MDAYIYCADLYCADCADEIMGALGPPPPGPIDSGDYPCGPYPDGGGESDSPCHCADCQTLLANPLTAAGLLYVVEAIEEWAESHPAPTLFDWESAVVCEWAEEYWNRGLSEHFDADAPITIRSGLSDCFDDDDAPIIIRS